MNRFRHSSILLTLVVGFAVSAGPTLRAGDADTILQSTGLNGGLCLIIGDDSLTLGKDLTKNSGLYVQILQADSKKAFRWGLDLAKSPQREQLGIRLSAFDPDEYGSQLFNLLIVNGKAAPAETTLKNLHRLLVPHGTLLMKKMPASFAKPAKQLGMKKGNVEVVGLKEVKGFEASAEKATAFGLTDNQPAKIRVFVLGEAPTSTRLKIMAFPERPGKMPNQKFIHSSIGISYLTLRVEDMTAALARLKKAKVKLLGETPASLGGNSRITVFRDPDGNFVELIGPVNE